MLTFWISYLYPAVCVVIRHSGATITVKTGDSMTIYIIIHSGTDIIIMFVCIVDQWYMF